MPKRSASIRSRVLTAQAELPLDMALFADEIEHYRRDPAECDKGEWVDAAFAEAWFAGAQKWDPSVTSYRTPLSALQLGPIGMLFHSSELYSYYGLALRRGSPFRDTLAVGYTDDFVGYLTDPAAYAAGEYAAAGRSQAGRSAPVYHRSGQRFQSPGRRSCSTDSERRHESLPRRGGRRQLVCCCRDPVLRWRPPGARRPSR